MQLPDAVISQTAFANKMETFHASTSVIIKGNTSFFNRVAIKLSNPISRSMGTPTRKKVEAKLRNKQREFEQDFRDKILGKLKKKTNIMDHIYETRLNSSNPEDVSRRIEKEKIFIRRKAKEFIQRWEGDNKTLKENLREGFFELFTDPEIYLGELIEASKNERPIIRRFTRVWTSDKGFIEVEKTVDFEKLGISKKTVGEKGEIRYEIASYRVLPKLFRNAKIFGIQIKRDGKVIG